MKSGNRLPTFQIPSVNIFLHFLGWPHPVPGLKADPLAHELFGRELEDPNVCQLVAAGRLH